MGESKKDEHSSKCSLILVRLSDHQIRLAKEVHGMRRRITHALLCGPHGKLFGTEVQCRLRFNAWRPERGLFDDLFSRAYEVDTWDFTDYESTKNLQEKLHQAKDGFDHG